MQCILVVCPTVEGLLAAVGGGGGGVCSAF